MIKLEGIFTCHNCSHIFGIYDATSWDGSHPDIKLICPNCKTKFEVRWFCDNEYRISITSIDKKVVSGTCGELVEPVESKVGECRYIPLKDILSILKLFKDQKSELLGILNEFDNSSTSSLL